MTVTIPAAPRATKNITVIVGTDDYHKHVSSVTINRNDEPISWKGGSPDAKYSDVVGGDPTCEVTLVHDYQNADSFFNFLQANNGVQGTLAYQPDADGAFTVEVEVTFMAPPIGGPVNAFNESTISFPCGEPDITFPV